MFVCLLFLVRASDKRIACDEEFSDSEDEGEGGRKDIHSHHKSKRQKVNMQPVEKMVANGTESTNGEGNKSMSNSSSALSKLTEEKVKSQNTSANTSKSSSAASSPKAASPKTVSGAEQLVERTEVQDTDKKM